MKWTPDNNYSSEYKLVDDLGEIHAVVKKVWGGEWRFAMRAFVDAESAKRAAEKSVGQQP